MIRYALFAIPLLAAFSCPDLAFGTMSCTGADAKTSTTYHIWFKRDGNDEGEKGTPIRVTVLERVASGRSEKLNMPWFDVQGRAFLPKGRLSLSFGGFKAKLEFQSDRPALIQSALVSGMYYKSTFEIIGKTTVEVYCR